MKPIRNSAKALIIAGGRILCTKNRDEQGFFYLLPGGGQVAGETLVETLQRECLEEIGGEVEVGELRLLREYISAHHEFAQVEPDVHQNEFMFLCRLKNPGTLISPSQPDVWQVGIEWLPVDTLAEVRIYPKILATILRPEGVQPGHPVYLGDVN